MNTTPLDLRGVPETMLWTLHNRASEARRPDTYLRDPDCVRIYEAIDYDYERSFGKPDDSHPMRSHLFDEALRPWLRAHRGGTVVELAAGLETQFQRCDDAEVHWLCVDVPEAIAVRERFLPAGGRCRFITRSALDPAWMDEVDGSRGVFVTAQGLFMYFTQAQVRGLLATMIERFPGVEIMFDTIPRWFSKKTLEGFAKTRYYTAPPMPWGINRGEIEPTLRAWSGAISRVRTIPYGFARGFGRVVLRVCASVPGLSNMPPTIVQVSTRPAAAV